MREEDKMFSGKMYFGYSGKKYIPKFWAYLMDSLVVISAVVLLLAIFTKIF